ncbi:MAG: hypothetical protein NZ551_06060 [Microscillaceae bacterium]|nr:hypothetical protein [Microscillaceae bacterium]MDW8460758.1 hypothetical protein [Cytophagales bacterium]
MNQLNFKLLAFTYLFFSYSLVVLYAQSATEQFGKNRIQYKKFDWRYYSTTNFDIYFYDDGVRLANFSARFLETEFDRITDIIGFTPYLKIRLFIYNSIADMQQSNVGIDDNAIQLGGQTNFFKSQMEVPYTGSEVEFKKELRLGLAQLLIKEMMFGGNLKDLLQNTYLGGFNEWFLLGAARYVAEGWSVEMDDYIRDLFNTRQIKRPHLLSGKEAIIVGQSVWNFIAEKYGPNHIANILNLARIIKSEKNSISSSLGIRYSSFMNQWQMYYTEMVKPTSEKTELPRYDFKFRKNNFKKRQYNQIKFSPDGQWIAYTELLDGKYKVFLLNTNTRKKKLLFSNRYRPIGQRYNYELPLIDWQNNTNLAIVYNQHGENQLKIINVNKKTVLKRTWYFFNHISDIDFSDDGNFLALSVDRKGEVDYKTGQNDIFIYDLKNTRMKQITDDWFDDRNPRFLPNSNTALVFSSNRITDTIQVKTLRTDFGNYEQEINDFNIFLYQPEISKQVFQRITQIYGEASQPIYTLDKQIFYLSDETGIKQLYRYDLKTGENQKLTNFRQSIITFDIAPQNQGWAFSTNYKTRPFAAYQAQLSFPINSLEHKTIRAELLAMRSNKLFLATTTFKIDTTQTLKIEKPYNPENIDTDDYQFDPEIVKEKQGTIEKTQKDLISKIKKGSKRDIKVIGSYPYQPRFKVENLATTFRIDPLRGFGSYINFASSDLLENHKFKGGWFLGSNLRNNIVHAEYQYFKNRLDYSLKFERDNIHFNLDPLINPQRYTLSRASAVGSYAFNNIVRASLASFYATTTFVNLGAVVGGLNRMHYVGARAEFVVDNSITHGANIQTGTRIKAYFEVYQPFAASGEITSIKRRDFTCLNVDARHNLRLHRDIILALRLGYGAFAGNSRKNFLLGGVDEWISNRTDTDRQGNPLRLASDLDNSDILFVRYVTPLRGFNYNRLFGNNYLLFNAEVRVPLFKYLFGKRITSSFFKNMQFIGFTDIGSAWTGADPFQRQNSVNTREVRSNNFVVTVNDFKSPFLQSFGTGVRTTIFGYYLKFDYAWRIEDYTVSQKGMLQVSLGYDF